MKNLRISLPVFLLAALITLGAITQTAIASSQQPFLLDRQASVDQQAVEMPVINVTAEVDITTTDNDGGGGINTTLLIIIIVVVLVLLVGILLGTQRHVHHDE